MKNAIFYLLEQNMIKDGLSRMEWLSCDLAAMKWRAGKRVLIACKDKPQALQLDKALWRYDPEAFVPHNLAGEGPHYGAPVEVCWPQRRGNESRDLLISLLPTCANFVAAFQEVIDFVPDEDSLKQLARYRYQAYRSIGFQLFTARCQHGEK